MKENKEYTSGDYYQIVNNKARNIKFFGENFKTLKICCGHTCGSILMRIAFNSNMSVPAVAGLIKNFIYVKMKGQNKYKFNKKISFDTHPQRGM